MRFLSLIFLLVSCVSEPLESTSEQMLGGFTDCSTTAIPDDGLDDRQAIQDAVTLKGCALLGPGVYDIDTPYPRLTGNNRYNMINLLSGRTLRGSGPSTVLRFRGAAGMSDWYGIGVGLPSVPGDDVLISDLLLDTSALTDTEEQTHAIQITGPSMRVTVRNVWFVHPQRGGTEGSLGGGDCIKIVSYDNRRTSAIITGNHFTFCDRSGISSIGGFHGLVIANNVFHDTGDQDIDIEANNTGYELAITGNAFRLGAHPQGAFAVSVSAPPSDGFSVVDNVMYGRGLYIYAGQRGTIANNTIVHKTGAQATIYVLKSSDALTFTGNTVVRTVTADPGPVLQFSPHGSSSPGVLAVTGNILRNETTWGTCVNADSMKTLTFTGNTCEWVPPVGYDPSIQTVHVNVIGNSQRVDSATFTGNTFRGPTTRALQFTGSGLGTGPITMTGNVKTDGGVGWKCTNPAGPIVSAGNNWAAPTTNSCTLGSGI